MNNKEIYQEDYVAVAAKFLSAFEQSGGRWVYRDHETSPSWWMVSEERMEELGEALCLQNQDVYSNWRSAGLEKEMPEWWEPNY